MKELRIIKTNKGFIVEQKKRSLFNSKWIPFVKYNGLSEVFPYSSVERCISDLPNYLDKNEQFKLEINL